MPKWIEDAKKFYKTTMKGTRYARSFIMALEFECYEKGYSLRETKEIVYYVIE